MYADLVKEETGKTGGNDGVTNHEVPVHPLPLDPVERGKVRVSVKLLSGIFMEDRGGSGSCVKGHDRREEGDEVEMSGNNPLSCTLLRTNQKSDHFIFPTVATPPAIIDHFTPSCDCRLIY